MADTRSKSLRNQDMTTGSIMKKMMLFAIPVLISTLFSQLYNMVDSIIVGRFVSAHALAAVGSSGSVMMIFYALMSGMNIGANVIVSQYFGAKKYDELNKTVITLIMVATCVTVVMVTLGVTLSPVFLRMLHTPDELMKDATVYLRISCAGILGQFFFYVGSFVLRGMGDSKWPSYMVILSSVINIILDLVFVVAFHLDVAGVALATAIAQTISAVVVFYRMAHHECLDFSRKNWKIDKTKIRPILSLGMPSAIQQLCLSLGTLIIQRFANTFGADFIASMTVVTKVDMFAMMPINSLGQALSTFVGQNVGAGKDDRVKKGVRDMTLTIVGLSVGMGVVMAFFGKYLMLLFTDSQPVIAMGIVCIQIMVFSYWGTALQQAYSGLLRGAGDALIPAVIMISALALRIPFTYLLAVRPNDYRGIFYCMAGAAILGGVAMLVYYRSGIWKKRNSVRIR
ncbi:MAG: MATE family efflux transporter [Ruminococcaceae bacterium]|nr:MATE family efflux transporter [Oscillospiraceae bacterium]